MKKNYQKYVFSNIYIKFLFIIQFPNEWNKYDYRRYFSNDEGHQDF